MRMIHAALIAALGLGASMLPGTASAGGAVFGKAPTPGSASSWSHDGCDGWFEFAKQGWPGAKCTMMGAHGFITVEFAAASAQITRAYGFDENNVGHFLTVTHNEWQPYFVNTKNYQNWMAEDVVSYWESPAPSRFSAPLAPQINRDTQFVFENRLFTHIGDHTLRQKPDQQMVGFKTTVYDDKGFASHDYCNFFYGSAEVGNPALLVQMNDQTAYSRAVWDGKGAMPTCSAPRYLARSIDETFYADAYNRFNRTSETKARLTKLYAQFGVNQYTDPLGVFRSAHQMRLSYGIHPLLSKDAVHGFRVVGETIGLAALAALTVAALPEGGPGAAALGASSMYLFDVYMQKVEDDANQNYGNTPTPESVNDLVSTDDLLALMGLSDVASGDRNGDGVGDANDFGDPTLDPGDQGGSGGCTQSDPSCTAITRVPLP